MDKNNTYIMDELLVKYMLKETNETENDLVINWIAQNEANKKQYDDFVFLWNESISLDVAVHVDEDKAWEKFKQKISEPELIISKNKPKFGVLKIAAAILVLIMGALFFYFNNAAKKQVEIVKEQPTIIINEQPQIAFEAQNESVSKLLQDGSKIVLNKNTKITYDSLFTGSTRKLTLNGEAFFNIAPDKQKPFIIATSNATIKVIGTSFNVKTINGKIEVIVETGIVQVYNLNDTITLLPNDKITIDETNKTFKKETAENKLYNHYFTKAFVCDNTPLWQLVEALNEAYNGKITIENKALNKMPITTTFNEESLDKILVIIGQTLGVVVEKENGIIKIK